MIFRVWGSAVKRHNLDSRAHHPGLSQRDPTLPLQPLSRALVLRKRPCQGSRCRHTGPPGLWPPALPCHARSHRRGSSPVLHAEAPGAAADNHTGGHLRPQTPSPVLAELPRSPLSNSYTQGPAVCWARSGSRGCGNEGDPCGGPEPMEELSVADTGPWTRIQRQDGRYQTLPGTPSPASHWQVTLAEGSVLPGPEPHPDPQLLNPAYFAQTWGGPRWEVSGKDRKVTTCFVGGAFGLQNSLYFSQRS